MTTKTIDTRQYEILIGQCFNKAVDILIARDPNEKIKAKELQDLTGELLSVLLKTREQHLTPKQNSTNKAIPL